MDKLVMSSILTKWSIKIHGKRHSLAPFCCCCFCCWDSLVYSGWPWIHHDTKDDLELLEFDPLVSTSSVLRLKYAQPHQMYWSGDHTWKLGRIIPAESYTISHFPSSCSILHCSPLKAFLYIPLFHPWL